MVSYNAGFEAGINKRLASTYPSHAKSLLGINARMVDLLVPFRKRSLYHPAQHSSASIKAVLPAFVPSLSYANLDIGDGGSASFLYLQLLTGKITGVAKDKLIADLKKYCELDTLAMVKLVEVIREHA